MKVIKESFLSHNLDKLFGDDCYDWLKSNARIIVAIGTCILSVLIGLSTICHFGFLCDLVSLVTGTSILFVLYVVALVVLLDIQVEIVEEEPDYIYYTPSEPVKKIKPKEYKLTIVWGVVLLILGIAAITFTNKYRKQYAFECTTFLVDHKSKEYHLEWDTDCEGAKYPDKLDKLKGYQIDDSYTFCIGCKEWAEDASFEYESNKYFRKQHKFCSLIEKALRELFRPDCHPQCFLFMQMVRDKRSHFQIIGASISNIHRVINAPQKNPFKYSFLQSIVTSLFLPFTIYLLKSCCLFCRYQYHIFLFVSIIKHSVPFAPFLGSSTIFSNGIGAKHIHTITIEAYIKSTI